MSETIVGRNMQVQEVECNTRIRFSAGPTLTKVSIESLENEDKESVKSGSFFIAVVILNNVSNLPKRSGSTIYTSAQ